MPNFSVATLMFGAGDSNASLPTVRLKLVSERLSAREIIAKAVAEQIIALQQLHSQDFDAVQAQLSRHYLSADDIKAQAQAGKVAVGSRRTDPAAPDVEREIQRALRSFQDRCFRVFVDNQELRTPDDTATLVDGSAVTFVRLIALAGG